MQDDIVQMSLTDAQYIGVYTYIADRIQQLTAGHSGEFVLGGYLAFCFSGVSVVDIFYPEILVPKGYLGKDRYEYQSDSRRFEDSYTYLEVERLEPDKFTVPFRLCKDIYLPTPERAIIDYIRVNEQEEKLFSSDYFVDTFDRYLAERRDNTEQLEEVAKYFNVSWELVDSELYKVHRYRYNQEQSCKAVKNEIDIQSLIGTIDKSECSEPWNIEHLNPTKYIGNFY